MKFIDISVSVSKKLPLWPGNTPPLFEQVSNLKKGGTCNETFLHMNAHAGTHIDAPLHFIQDGDAIDKMDLSIFSGPAYVADFTSVKEITKTNLEKKNIPSHTTKLLFKTSNSELWGNETEFKKDYVGLTPDGAEWIAANNFDLVGNDYLSIAKFEDAVEVHNILLGKGIAVLEGINLSSVEEGEYELTCFPIKLAGIEAASTRAVLIVK